MAAGLAAARYSTLEPTSALQCLKGGGQRGHRRAYRSRRSCSAICADAPQLLIHLHSIQLDLRKLTVSRNKENFKFLYCAAIMQSIVDSHDRTSSLDGGGAWAILTEVIPARELQTERVANKISSQSEKEA